MLDVTDNKFLPNISEIIDRNLFVKRYSCNPERSSTIPQPCYKTFHPFERTEWHKKNRKPDFYHQISRLRSICIRHTYMKFGIEIQNILHSYSGNHVGRRTDRCKCWVPQKNFVRGRRLRWTPRKGIKIIIFIWLNKHVILCDAVTQHNYPTLAREFQGFRVWGKCVFRTLELTETPNNLANQVTVGHALDQSRSV